MCGSILALFPDEGEEEKKDILATITTITTVKEMIARQKPAAKRMLVTPVAKKWGEGDITKTLPVREDADIQQEYTIFDLAVYVARKTGIPAEYLLCILWQESKFGRNVGMPAKGISDAKINRDAVLAYALSVKFGYNPCVTPASKSGRKGYGGAIGIAQLLPSTYAVLGGWSITFTKRFSDYHNEYSAVDASLIQSEVNDHFGAEVISVDGIIGQSSRRWIVKYFQETLDKKHLPENLRDCVKDPGFVKTLFTIQKGYKLQYNPSKDRIAKTLGVKGPCNPWEPIVSATGGALLLKDLGIKWRPKYATGAYFAGPSRAFGTSGKRYTKSTFASFLWVQSHLRAYYSSKGWRV